MCNCIGCNILNISYLHKLGHLLVLRLLHLSNTFQELLHGCTHLSAGNLAVSINVVHAEQHCELNSVRCALQLVNEKYFLSATQKVIICNNDKSMILKTYKKLYPRRWRISKLGKSIRSGEFSKIKLRMYRLR